MKTSVQLSKKKKKKRKKEKMASWHMLNKLIFQSHRFFFYPHSFNSIVFVILNLHSTLTVFLSCPLHGYSAIPLLTGNDKALLKQVASKGGLRERFHGSLQQLPSSTIGSYRKLNIITLIIMGTLIGHQTLQMST